MIHSQKINDNTDFNERPHNEKSNQNQIEKLIKINYFPQKLFQQLWKLSSLKEFQIQSINLLHENQYGYFFEIGEVLFLVKQRQKLNQTQSQKFNYQNEKLLKFLINQKCSAQIVSEFTLELQNQQNVMMKFYIAQIIFPDFNQLREILAKNKEELDKEEIDWDQIFEQSEYNQVNQKIKQVFKSQQYNLMKLSQLNIALRFCQIQMQGAKIISHGLVKLNQIKPILQLQLNLYSNALADEGVNSLSQAFMQLQQLQSLELILMINLIGNNGLKQLATNLSYLQNLEKLMLNLQNNKFGDAGVSYITKSLKNLPKLKELELNFYFNQTEKLGEIIGTDIQNLTVLNKIDISFNKVDQSDSVVFIEGILKLNNLNYLKLELEHCLINQRWVESFTQKSNLNFQSIIQIELDLQYNHIGSQGFCELFFTFSKFPRIESIHLNFTANSIIDGDFAQDSQNDNYFFNSLISLHINLCWCQVGIRGSRFIGKLIQNSPFIQNLTLAFQDNLVGDYGLQILSQNIFSLSNLTRLKLDLWGSSNQISDQGLAYLSEHISKSRQLLRFSLILVYNQYTIRGLKTLYQSLKNCKKLNLIETAIYNLNVTQKDEDTFGNWIKKCKRLCSYNNYLLI